MDKNEGYQAVALELGKNLEQVIAERDRARQLLEMSDARVVRLDARIAELEARLADAERQISRLFDAANHAKNDCVNAECYVCAAEAENARLRSALEEYADEGNWLYFKHENGQIADEDAT